MAVIHRVHSSREYQTVRAPLTEILKLGDGVAVADEIVQQSGWMLHELDFGSGQAVFLQQPEAMPVFTAPFAYQEQASNAKCAAFLPFTDFLALSKRLPLPPRLIHLFNIGHCGSTLLHQVFNASGAAQCISEPKFTFDLPWNREKVTPNTLAELCRACLSFLALLPGMDASRPLILKHFSQGTRMMETWAASAPGAVNLFLYRDAVSWANSRYGFVQRRGLVADLTPESKHQRWAQMSVGAPESFLDGLLDISSDELRFDDFAAISWAMCIQDHRRAKGTGMELHDFRYNELLADRASQMVKIFAVCGLPTDSLEAALAAFAKPAHEGTSSDRSKPARNLPMDSRQRMTRLLAKPPLALDPDLIL